MAIIKPIQYKGFQPYWWNIKEKRLDILNNTTTVILCLYADTNTAKKNKDNYLDGIYFTDVINGVDLTNDEIMETLITKNTNGFFNAANNVSENYIIEDNRSSIYQKISNDPATGIIRFAECDEFTYNLRNAVVKINMIIYFDTTSESIDDSGNTITVINTDVTKFIADNKKTKNITWIVDDMNIIPNTQIGEFTYFNNLRLGGLKDEDVISRGIAYGDSVGRIDIRLK